MNVFRRLSSQQRSLGGFRGRDWGEKKDETPGTTKEGREAWSRPGDLSEDRGPASEKRRRAPPTAAASRCDSTAPDFVVVVDSSQADSAAGRTVAGWHLAPQAEQRALQALAAGSRSLCAPGRGVGMRGHSAHGRAIAPCVTCRVIPTGAEVAVTGWAVLVQGQRPQGSTELASVAVAGPRSRVCGHSLAPGLRSRVLRPSWGDGATCARAELAVNACARR